MQSLEFYIPQTPGTTTPLVQCPPPFNWQELMLELSFENQSPAAIINATKLIWKSENAHFMNAWLQTGLVSGGVGIFEGIPLQIKVCQTQQIVFDGIIDLTDSETKWTCDNVEVKIRDKRMDMVSQLMDSISYCFLATPTSQGGGGLITPSDYVVIPYQRNNVPDYTEFFITGLAIYNIAEKTYDVIDKLGGLIAGATAATASISIGAMILAVVEILFYIAYIALMILVIFAMMKAAFNYLVSPVLTKFGMYAGTLMQKACDYFNIGFECSFKSTILDRLVIIPQKQAWINNQSFTRTLYQGIVGGGTYNNRMEYDDLFNLQNGGMAYGYWDGTCADFIRAMADVFNAKAKIIIDSFGKPVLHFERWDYIYNQSNYTLPNISDQTPFNSAGLFNSNGFSQSAFRTNASEIPANYMVKYALDDSDRNTYNYYDGTMCYCTTSPINSNELKNVTLQNLVEKNLRFAQAFRKDKLTTTEEALIPVWQAAAAITNSLISVISGFDSVINTVTSFLPSSANTNLPTIANGGLQYMPSMPTFAMTGHLMLSGDTTGVPKMFMAGPTITFNNFFDFQSHQTTGVEIDANNKNIIGARYLLKNFHFSNLGKTVVPPAPYNVPYVAGADYFNQWIIYENQEVPLCCEEWQLIYNNNYIKTFNGKFARMDSSKWNAFKGISRMDYRINDKFTDNLKTSFVVDGALTLSQL